MLLLLLDPRKPNVLLVVHQWSTRDLPSMMIRTRLKAFVVVVVIGFIGSRAYLSRPLQCRKRPALRRNHLRTFDVGSSPAADDVRYAAA